MIVRLVTDEPPFLPDHSYHFFASGTGIDVGAQDARDSSALSRESEVGKKAPYFALHGATGATHDLAAYRGKYVVLEWTNYFCPCVKKFYDSGQLPAFQREAQDKLPLVWFQVTSSAKDKLGFIAPEDAPGAQKEVKSATTDLLLDHEGTADLEKSKNYVRLALEQHAAGKPVPFPVTKSYGCAVKYKVAPQNLPPDSPHPTAVAENAKDPSKPVPIRRRIVQIAPPPPTPIAE
jgi:hypothetical protein